MALVGADAFTIMGIPNGGGVVLSAGEEEVSFTVILEEGKGSFMALEQDGPHGSSTDWTSTDEDEDENENEDELQKTTRRRR